MREPLLVALRKEAARLHPRLPTEEDVATAAGVAVADVRTHLGPPDNYSALLSYQGQTLDTRARIIASAARVFGQKGFQRASLDQVASDAGLTKGAIYWHFKSKNDLYFALLDSRFQRDIYSMRDAVSAMVSTATRETAPALMAQIFCTGLQRATSDPDWPRLFVEVLGQSREPEVRERIAQFYEQGWEFAANMARDLQAHGLIRQDLSPDLIATFWFAIGDGLILAWLNQPDRINLEALTSGILDMLWCGIAPTSDNKNTGAAAS